MLHVCVKLLHMQFAIPKEVMLVTDTLRKAGFEAYLVGGCVRDLVLGRTPKDWDVTTNATPEEIQALFPDTFYENEYGTVGVVTHSAGSGQDETASDEAFRVIEVTPYRSEGAYSDNRRPDSVSWSSSLEDDLKRRDFTINALAYDDAKNELVDSHNGKKDLKERILRAVGEPDVRFAEDALRMMRAARIATELGRA